MKNFHHLKNSDSYGPFSTPHSSEDERKKTSSFNTLLYLSNQDLKLYHKAILVNNYKRLNKIENLFRCTEFFPQPHTMHSLPGKPVKVPTLYNHYFLATQTGWESSFHFLLCFKSMRSR